MPIQEKHGRSVIKRSKELVRRAKETIRSSRETLRVSREIQADRDKAAFVKAAIK